MFTGMITIVKKVFEFEFVSADQFCEGGNLECNL